MDGNDSGHDLSELKQFQDEELEAVESIYCQEMEILDTNPHKFLITMQSKEYDPSLGTGLCCKIKFELPPTYPHTVPLMEIMEGSNFRDEDENDLMQHLSNEAETNSGSVMIYTLVSSTQEWMDNKWDEICEERENAAIRKAKEEEEAEMKKFEGTRVTVETFLNWKEAFEAEMNAKNKKIKDEREGRKLTGRELFLEDKTLIDSDLQFLNDGGDSVKVDESLFQDLEELDIEDDSEDSS